MFIKKTKEYLRKSYNSSGAWQFWSTAIFTFVAIALFIGFYFYRIQIKEFSKNAVETYGYPALFFLCWASDVIIQPIPADVFVFGTTFGGAEIVRTAMVAGFSSAFGGASGYYVGKLFGPWRFRRLFGSSILKQGSKLFKKHGSLTIFISGITPIPYSATCWIGGIYGMPILNVIIASWISRTLRYLVVAWLGNVF